MAFRRRKFGRFRRRKFMRRRVGSRKFMRRRGFRRGNKPVIARMSGKGMWPDRVRTCLTYSNTQQFAASGLGANAYYGVVRANGPFHPVIAGSGFTATTDSAGGLGQLLGNPSAGTNADVGMYQYAQVLGSSIRFEVQGTDSLATARQNLLLYCYPHTSGAGYTGSNRASKNQIPRVKRAYKTLGGIDTGLVYRVKNYASTSRVVHRDTSANLITSAGGYFPIMPWYWFLEVMTSDLTNFNDNHVIYVTIKYYMEFWGKNHFPTNLDPA